MIEIEKTYLLSENDYNLIKENCKFIWEKELLDIYYDTPNLLLYSNKYKLRNRNWQFELKFKKTNRKNLLQINEEIIWKENIEKELQEKFSKQIKDFPEICRIESKREIYETEYLWEILQISVDKFKYWSKYEIEVNTDKLTEQEAENLIENYRTEIWLTSHFDESVSKITMALKYENPKVYKLLKEIDENDI